MKSSEYVVVIGEITLLTAPRDGEGFYATRVSLESTTYVPGTRSRWGLSRGTTHAERETLKLSAGTEWKEYQWPEFKSRCPYTSQAYALEHLAQVLRSMKK